MADEQDKQRKYNATKIAAGAGMAADAAVKAAEKLAAKNPKLAPVVAAAKTAKKAVPYVAKAVDIIPDEVIDKAVDTAAKGAAVAAAGAKDVADKAKGLPGKAREKVYDIRGPKYEEPVAQTKGSGSRGDDVIVVEARVWEDEDDGQ